VLVDPNDAADVAAVAAIQDGFAVAAGSAGPFVAGDYDTASLDATRSALLELNRHIDSLAGAFGRKSEVDPVKHLIGTGAGFGGLLANEAFYVNVDPEPPVGRYELEVRDVPVDGFWSISVHNADGYFPNSGQLVSVNNLTAARTDDGAVTVHFGDWGADTPNRLPIDDGWNCLVRLYRPRPEILDGSWTFPSVKGA